MYELLTEAATLQVVSMFTVNEGLFSVDVFLKS